jgi:competence protein ComEA
MNSSSIKQGVVLLTLGILIGLLIGGIIWITASPPRGKPVTLGSLPTEHPITVYISGEVLSPGVYKLPFGSRVQDLVVLAGGFLPAADTAGINLAALLVDSSQIDIKLNSTASTSLEINTATADELETLPGIGPTAAKNIIEFRLKNGQFDFIEDIQKVAGIGPVTFEKIKTLITTGK